ncbi:MAG: hypothetical protein NZ770_00080 [Candidatus Poseidoniaceae archaeon]|nr:hypothetical protein [Candidatus Poseidoniaceae archaeon]
MRKEVEDDNQSSLDSFITESIEPAEILIPPPVTGIDPTNKEPLRRIEMPSERTLGHAHPPPADVLYHDLERLYPAAPIPEEGGFVLHRGMLQDLTGLPQLLDWVSDGDVAIVEMGRMMQREVEFETALNQLHIFIENDLKGQIVQLTASRLLLLPPGCRGIRGVDDEAFAAGPLE